MRCIYRDESDEKLDRIMEGKIAMKKTDKKIEHFWEDLEVRKTDEERELQRKIV